MEVNLIQSAISAAAVVPSNLPERIAEHGKLIRAVKALNASDLLGNDRELSFGLDRETKRPVIRVVDRNTHEVIQQIPPEYAVRMAEELEA